MEEKQKDEVEEENEEMQERERGKRGGGEVSEGERRGIGEDAGSEGGRKGNRKGTEQWMVVKSYYNGVTVFCLFIRCLISTVCPSMTRTWLQTPS